MKKIKLYLWSSDGYDCVDWEMDAEISIEDYNRIVELLKQYKLDCFQDDDEDEEDCEFELLNSKEFTDDYLSEKASEIHSKLEKQANVVIEESFEDAKNSDILDMSIDDYNYGYWIHYDWMNSIIDIDS